MPVGRGFGVLWSANALSNLADGLAFVSMPLLAASMTDDARLVAGLATLYALVRLLVALPIGVWVDRFDRRTEPDVGLGFTEVGEVSGKHNRFGVRARPLEQGEGFDEIRLGVDGVVQRSVGVEEVRIAEVSDGVQGLRMLAVSIHGASLRLAEDPSAFFLGGARLELEQPEHRLHLGKREPGAGRDIGRGSRRTGAECIDDTDGLRGRLTNIRPGREQRQLGERCEERHLVGGGDAHGVVVADEPMASGRCRRGDRPGHCAKRAAER